jgi:hypothetical protein
MANTIFTLDVAVSPAEEFLFTMAEGGWVIALAAVLVISAVIGIIVFNNKKNKGDKK